ncbi:hypothetical protein NMY22_g15568 [Coprinellus aureogranulatus]|nr:hypothetical protein NMY22_g15568 [Coprinellus aureogranulatus]
MLLNRPLTSLIALLSVSSAFAVDICTYTNRNCRSSTFGCCSNVPAGACCFWQYDFLGWSVQFRNMTGNWIGNTYTDNSCGVQAGATGASAGATGACIAVPTTSNVNWFSGRFVINATAPTPPAKAVGSSECRVPDTIGFTHSGKEYRIDLVEGQFESAAQLIQEENWDALAELALEA